MWMCRRVCDHDVHAVLDTRDGDFHVRVIRSGDYCDIPPLVLLDRTLVGLDIPRHCVGWVRVARHADTLVPVPDAALHVSPKARKLDTAGAA